MRTRRMIQIEIARYYQRLENKRLRKLGLRRDRPTEKRASAR